MNAQEQHPAGPLAPMSEQSKSDRGPAALVAAFGRPAPDEAAIVENWLSELRNRAGGLGHVRGFVETVFGISSRTHPDAWRFVPWGRLTPELVDAMRRNFYRRSDYAASSVSTVLGAIGGIIEEARKSGWYTREQAADLKERLTERMPSPDVSAVTPDLLTNEDFEALVETTRTDAHAPEHQIRDRAILFALRVGGLRRVEVTRMNVDDYDVILGHLTVRGKGKRQDKVRTIPVLDGFTPALNRWLDVRPPSPEPAMFLGLGNRARGTRLSRTYISKMVKERCEAAGGGPYSTHDFRAASITHMLEAGIDVAWVAKYHGHSDLKTTLGYDRRKVEQSIRAAEDLYNDFRGLGK